MIAFLFVFFGQSFDELSSSIGKHQTQTRRQSIYTLGFLSLIGAAVMYLVLIFIRQKFLFSWTSLPTLLIRIILEIAQAHVTALAIMKVSRSTFGFIRIITIPLLLLVDLVIGYSVSPNQIWGIIIIAIALIVLFIKQGLETKHLGLVLFTAINAVATISLYKYNITHYNSVEAEQLIVVMALMVYFFLMAKTMAQENPIKFLNQPVFIAQSLAAGAANSLVSFAYLFASASVITTLKRSMSVLLSTASGHIYFKEKNIIIKLIAFFFIILGVVLLTI